MIGIGEVHEAFADWLALPDVDHGGHCFDTVDLALAVVVGNRLDGDPLWLFLVAPPSSGKTETLMSLMETEDVYALNNLTPATFISGYERKGGDASLLPKVNGKTIVMKDFTSILTMHRDARAEILSQLREIYDGAYSKDFGNGKHFQWDGKVGLLAGVTPVIDREYAFNAALGERFLLSRVRTAPARELARRALEQRSREADRRRRLRQLVAEFLAAVPLAPPAIPPAISERQPTLIVAYQHVLSRLWCLNTPPADHTVDPAEAPALLAELARLVDELGPTFATAVSRAHARAWAKAMGRCPWCGTAGVFP